MGLLLKHNVVLGLLDYCKKKKIIILVTFDHSYSLIFRDACLFNLLNSTVDFLEYNSTKKYIKVNAFLYIVKCKNKLDHYASTCTFAIALPEITLNFLRQ